MPSAGNPQSLNRYSYVLNNPVKYTDPSGHCPTAEEGGCERDRGDKGNVIVHEDQPFRGVTISAPNSSDGSGSPKLPATAQNNPMESAFKTWVNSQPGATYWSLGGNFGFAKVKGLSVDIVVNWESGDIAIYGTGADGWGIPQAGGNIYKGQIWGLDSMEEYAGPSLGSQLSVAFIGAEGYFGQSGNYFFSKPTYFAQGGGIAPSVPSFSMVTSASGNQNQTQLLGSLHVGKDPLKVIATIEFIAGFGGILNPLGIGPQELISAWVK